MAHFAAQMRDRAMDMQYSYNMFTQSVVACTTREDVRFAHHSVQHYYHTIPITTPFPSESEVRLIFMDESGQK